MSQHLQIASPSFHLGKSWFSLHSSVETALKSAPFVSAHETLVHAKSYTQLRGLCKLLRSRCHPVSTHDHRNDVQKCRNTIASFHEDIFAMHQHNTRIMTIIMAMRLLGSWTHGRSKSTPKSHDQGMTIK